MKINELLMEATLKLKENKSDTPRLDAEVIMAFHIGKERSYLIMHFNDELDSKTTEKFREDIERRALGEPVAYITGYKGFMDLMLQVDKSVLIPRPDTEVLVETILERFKSKQSKIKAIDIGTGSGAIALALAYYLENVEILAVDIDRDALEKARMNGCRLGLDHKVEFQLSDCFSAVEEGAKFDLVVSNPPYISKKDMDMLARNVIGYEPVMALYGGLEGMDFYNRITKEAPRYLNEKGILAYEIGYDQGQKVKTLMEKHGFASVEIIKDLAGIDRVVIGFMAAGN
ncbi:MAG: peptide chain release factor N(5)-glutamine methyltransferase [Eubacteriaceae bacterium]|nr:peptide chain release factor N(5)-glutamine methyltransferase [Eubacteriaceae bacterium]